MIVTATVLALAGIQWQRPIEGINVFFALDRSDSVPISQQEESLRWLNQVGRDNPKLLWLRANLKCCRGLPGGVGFKITRLIAFRSAAQNLSFKT